MKPDDLLTNPWAPGLLGSLLGQRALSGATWPVRIGYFVSCWATSVLFGPWVAGWIGADGDPRAFSAVVGAVAVFGLVLFDSALRWLRETPFPDVLDRLQRVIDVMRGRK